MIRAVAAFLSLGGAAQAELPSPLFCNTVALCQSAGDCVAPDDDPHFVLRQTGGEWLKEASPRGADTWVILGATAQAVLDTAPEGARIAMVEAGATEDGAILLHQHMLEPTALSAEYLRHECRAGDGEAA
ncbi:hypothetical protein [Gymnodinialimonas sp.]